ADAAADGRLPAAQLARSAERLAALAARFPSQPGADPQRAADNSLMDQAWACGLTALGGARPPLRHQPLRVLTQASVLSDGVSEAGLASEMVRGLFTGFSDVRFDTVPSLVDGPWPAAEGRFTVLVGNQRPRYGAQRPAADLHLVLWNPYQALDIAAPALLSWGYAPGALAAVQAWLEGRAAAPGRLPITLECR
ncbi:MAG: beta-N-acetylhexosaminidase, partial [Rubrivivax sp.]